MTKREQMEAAIARRRAEVPPPPPPKPPEPPKPVELPKPVTKKKWKPKGPVDQRLDMEMPTDRRLPDGSKFEATYAAETKRWHGTLTLTSGVVFTEDSGAVMKLLKKLDIQYRKWLEEIKQANGVNQT